MEQIETGHYDQTSQATAAKQRFWVVRLVGKRLVRAPSKAEQMR